jgi:CubicO group peptidase (beta-lactamase class C family)
MLKKFLWVLATGWLAACLWGCGLGQTALAQPIHPDSPPLRALLAQQKEERGVKALLAGVWVGHQEVLTLALGESMTGVPASTEMHLRIGGISETFQGTLLMQLVDSGQIRLDDKVSRWLPNLLAADQITLQMLIQNTAGYKDYVVHPQFIQRITDHPFEQVTRQQIYDYATQDGQLAYPPDTSQKYSHTDFTILGDILEKATHRSMADLYQKEIFQPLGLTHTGYSNSPDLPPPLLHSFSSQRGVYEESTFWNPSWTGESGPLYSTLGDLRIWAQSFGKGSLLTPASFAQLTQKPKSAARPDLYFASGFVVANGWYVQNPGFNGYSGAFAYLPARDLTILVFTTQGENPKSDAQAFTILKKVAESLAPQSPINL